MPTKRQKKIREGLVKILADWCGIEIWNTADEKRHNELFPTLQKILPLIEEEK